jgi:Xaa-Pro aminopeptidase
VEGDFEAILITSPENIVYVLGFKVESDITILISKEDSKTTEGKILIFSSALEYDEIKKNIEEDKVLSDLVEILRSPPGVPNFIEKEIRRLEFEFLGFEDDYISVKRFEEWKMKYGVPGFMGISDVLLDARLIKTQNEIERMKRAAELGDIGFDAVLNSIKVGKTEKEIAAEAEYAMRKAGGDGTSFDTIIATGENSTFPHATTSEKKIDDGDIIIVDIGSRYNGYCSDMTRTFIFGKVDPEKAKLVNLVNDCQQHVLDNIKAGLICADVDELARGFFNEKEKDWSSRFIHSLGHGVGIEIHENPYLSPISHMILGENMIVTVEPGLYIPGLGGARTEDLIVIKNDGFDCLTQSKKFHY